MKPEVGELRPGGTETLGNRKASPAWAVIDQGSREMVIAEQIASCQRRFNSSNFVSLRWLLAESALHNTIVYSHGSLKGLKKTQKPQTFKGRCLGRAESGVDEKQPPNGDAVGMR